MASETKTVVLSGITKVSLDNIRRTNSMFQELKELRGTKRDLESRLKALKFEKEQYELEIKTLTQRNNDLQHLVDDTKMKSVHHLETESILGMHLLPQVPFETLLAFYTKNENSECDMIYEQNQSIILKIQLWIQAYKELRNEYKYEQEASTEKEEGSTHEETFEEWADIEKTVLDEAANRQTIDYINLCYGMYKSTRGINLYIGHTGNPDSDTSLMLLDILTSKQYDPLLCTVHGPLYTIFCGWSTHVVQSIPDKTIVSCVKASRNANASLFYLEPVRQLPLSSTSIRPLNYRAIIEIIGSITRQLSANVYIITNTAFPDAQHFDNATRTPSAFGFPEGLCTERERFEESMKIMRQFIELYNNHVAHRERY